MEPYVREFHDMLARSPDMAVAVAAIKALTSVIRNSKSSTMMQLDVELKEAAAALQRCDPTSISLKAGCELFLRYVTRSPALENEWEPAKVKLIERGDHFAKTSISARQTIANLGERFVGNGVRVLVHGYSRVALSLLRQAKQQGSHFSVILTEGRPDQTGLKMARAIHDVVGGCPVTMVLDSAAAYIMDRVDMVLVGAEGVVESGGIINKLGTYNIAVVAKARGVPFYVAAESYKFARLYPLGQTDLPLESKPVDFAPLLPAGTHIDNPSRDYTPPDYISLLFTDLGVLTPAAVSDELIQLYL